MFVTLSQLQNKIKQTIELNVKAQWVLCDVSDMKVNGAGHCYLELVEKNEGRGAIPKAKATAIIWKNDYRLMHKFFLQKTGMELVAGMKVMLLVEVNYHELYGLSLVVRDIDPTYSLGDIERTRRETIARLEADGVINMNRELELSVVIERVAVISSATAAGYDDFVNHISSNSYGYSFCVHLYEAVVQGEAAESSIIDALMRIADSANDYDAVIIIRGGGSQSDLSCFNNYMLSSYIAQFPIPIITGIGHNKDQSVADVVAHTSLKTPTAVANFLIDTKREFEEVVSSLNQRLNELATLHINNERKQLDSLMSRLRITTFTLTSSSRILVERLNTNIINSCKNIITSHHHQLSLLDSRIDSRDPKYILQMGYSLVTHNGKAVKSKKNVAKDDQLEIIVSDGTIKTIVV